MELRDASGSPRTYADDERAREVGQACNIDEVTEQRRATGGGRGWREEVRPREPRGVRHRSMPILSAAVRPHRVCGGFVCFWRAVKLAGWSYPVSVEGEEFGFGGCELCVLS